MAEGGAGFHTDKDISKVSTQKQHFPNEMSKSEHLIVAAIDIGTTYSTYAYSTRDDFKRNPLKIFAKGNWVSSEHFVGEKTATALLFDENKNLCKFGFEAEDSYADPELCAKERENFYFFYRFKMNLFERKKYQENMQLEDIRGKKMPAMDVFSAAIAYLMNHLLKMAKDKLPGINESDFKWVITVPAIWEDGARQFMRNATIKAFFWKESDKGDGVMVLSHGAFAKEVEKREAFSNRIILALEPEAAALYCKNVQLQLIRNGDQGTDTAPFSPGQRFLLVDLGGGTSDMIAYEVLESFNLRELTEPNGGDGGGVKVDEAFWDLVRKHLGDTVIDEFIETESSDFLGMQRNFELKKRSISISQKKGTLIKLPISLSKTYKKEYGVKLKEDMISPEDGVSYSRDKLKLTHEVSLGLYEKPKNKLLRFLEERYFASGNCYKLDAIVMVGGFSECEIIKDEVKAIFEKKNIKVILPEDGILAVVKGAVIYGHDPMAISERVLPFTYGISLRVKFDEAIHPVEKRFWCDKRQSFVAEDVFKPFIRAGTCVKPGESFIEHTHTALYYGSNVATIEIYGTKDQNPRFVTDEGCKKVGEIKLQIPNLQESGSKLIDIKMSFGNTELTVVAKEHDSDNLITAVFNFLIYEQNHSILEY